MSPRKSNETLPAPAPAGVHRKPRPDLYTVLLAIALVAVILGILFLYLEMQQYEFKIDGAPMVGMIKWAMGSGPWAVTIINHQSSINHLPIPNP